MILKECRDWVDAFGDCFRGASIGKLKRTLSALDADGCGRWQVGLRSDRHFKEVDFRYFGAHVDFPGFQRRAVALFGELPRARRRPAGLLPWLAFRWDQDELVSPFLCSGHEGLFPDGERIAFRVDQWSPAAASDAQMKDVFADIAALYPIREIVSRWRINPGGEREARPQWALRFARGVAWPGFARLTLSSPFAGDAALMAYLLLNRRVAEVEFDGGSLGVYFEA